MGWVWRRFDSARPDMLLNDFNARDTLLGGQSFLWFENAGAYYAFHSSFVLKLFYENGTVRVEQLWGDEISLEDYFQIDYQKKTKEKILKSSDERLKKALSLGELFVLAQPFYDTLFSFIASSNNKIERIRKLNFDLAKNFGKTVKIDGLSLSLYPAVSDLAQIKEKEFRKLGYGFRAKYMQKSAQALAKSKKDSLLLDELLALPGVGDKIADCVLVFSGKEHNFSPADVWMARILKELYGFESKRYQDYREFFKKKWGSSSALVAQYLFEYYRTEGALTTKR